MPILSTNNLSYVLLQHEIVQNTYHVSKFHRRAQIYISGTTYSTFGPYPNKT
jgi:hypothetical protein